MIIIANEKNVIELGFSKEIIRIMQGFSKPVGKFLDMDIYVEDSIKDDICYIVDKANFLQEYKAEFIKLKNEHNTIQKIST